MELNNALHYILDNSNPKSDDLEWQQSFNIVLDYLGTHYDKETEQFINVGGIAI